MRRSTDPSRSPAQHARDMLKEYAHGAGGGFPGCLRDKTRAIFAELLGPGANVDEDEIDVRHLVAALKRDAPPEGDGALAAMLHLPKRIRAGGRQPGQV